MKVLLSINSKEQDKYFTQALSLYKKEYSDLDVTFKITGAHEGLAGWQHCWTNRGYILDNYQCFDFVIDQDDDIFIPRRAFDYYVEYSAKLPLEYIPGFLSTEEYQGNVRLLTMCPLFGPMIKEELTLYGERYFIPTRVHSACFMVDRMRLERAQLSREPFGSRIPLPDMARSEIYTKLKKVIPWSRLDDCLVKHLQTKYTALGNIPLLTPEDFKERC